MWLDPELYKLRLSRGVIALRRRRIYHQRQRRAATPRAGVEKFAHGGIFPEEVVVPWLVFGRDVVPTSTLKPHSRWQSAGRDA